VGIDEARRHELAGQFQHLRLGTDEGANLVVAAHGHDAVPPDGDGLGDSVAGVHGENLAAHEHLVGRLDRWGG